VAGLDLHEMGALAYPDFLEAQGPVFYPVDDAALAGDLSPPTGASIRQEVGS
jgi:hypothetical protein